ncbi:MAG: DNA gyrase inhibitor YacG [Pseudolabrys sp.]
MNATNDNNPKAGTCAICRRPVDPAFSPFCSKRCADIDLNRWLTGVYAVPVTEEEDEDGERPREPGEET